MTENQLIVRRKNSFLATPLQMGVSCLVFMFFSVLFNALTVTINAFSQHQWGIATLGAIFSFVCMQLTLTNALATPLMFFYFKEMNHRNYSSLDLWSTRVINLHNRLGLWKTPTYYTLKINRALCRIWLGHLADAELEMREVAQDQIRDPSTRINLANNLAYAIIKNNGSLDEAEASANKCLSMLKLTSPALDSAPCIFPFTNLGVIYRHQEKYEQSEEMFKKALACRPPGLMTMSMFPMSAVFTQVNASLSLIDVLFQRGKDQEALELLRAIIRRIDGDPGIVSLECLDALSYVATALMERQRFKEAEYLLEHAYILAGGNPDFPDAQTMLGSYVKLLEKTDRAAEIPDLKRWIRPLHMLTQIE